jgi:pimeloyl-ACP methyl ester carboxylesterase
MGDLLLRRPGADLAYQVDGAGPVVGYSHGMLLSRATEDAMGLLDWSPLTARRLVRYDARAHGASTGRAEPGDYTWPNLAGDLLALADAVAPDGPVDWMGGSMGCGTLLWAATHAPERFRRLVLLIPPTSGATRVAGAAMYRSGAEAVETAGLASWVAALNAYAKPPIFDGVDSFRLDVAVAEPLLPAVLRGAASTDLPAAGALAGVAHPALILAWDTDPVHPVSTAEYLAGVLPRAELHVSTTVDDVRSWPARAAAFLAG